MAKRKVHSGNGAFQLPLFVPESDWRPPEPSQWPDYRGRAKIIGFDTEGHDPRLKTEGPGYIRGDAFLCGISLSSEDGNKIYLPIRHDDDNLDRDQVIRYVKHQLGGDQEKVGANVVYDFESLWSVGIEVKGTVRDIQIAEPLIDEERIGGYSLSNLSRFYLNEDKEEDLLEQAAIDYGVTTKGGMKYLPARYVGPYAEEDAYLPIRIYEKQRQTIKDEDLDRVFELETKLTKVLFEMRLRGVRVDMDKAEENSNKIKKIEEGLIKDITDIAGYRINPASGDDIAKYLSREGVSVPMTNTYVKSKGRYNYSVTAEWLKSQSHPVCKKIVDWRKNQKMRKDFIDKILNESVNGRIHTNWRQMRDYDEDGNSTGTRSGRIAASNFNLTQVPSRDPYWGPLIRSMFIADEGKGWGKADYSQQEPRLMVHFAYVMSKTRMGTGRYAGIEQARQQYIDHPDTDYHELTNQLIIERTGMDIGRKRAKGINLGAAYGMGKYKLANQLGIDMEQAETLLRAYHAGVPYVKDLGDDCMKICQTNGFVRTLLGRRRRFKFWEPVNWDLRQDINNITMDKQYALEQWGHIQRAYAHKAMNAAIQGSAADQMKTAIVLLYEQGLMPQIQVYDELNGSYEEEEMWQVSKTMEEAIPLELPFLAEPEYGTSWGSTKAMKRN